MKISLTFDNGPTSQVTPLVLNTLARHGAKASFFVLGKQLAVPAQRALAVRAVAEGHRLGNHSYSHATPFGELARPEAAIEEVVATQALLGDLAGRERLFRPFGKAEIGRHLLNRPLWDHLAAQRYTCVLWNCISWDFVHAETWVAPTVQDCAKRDWSVVVMHDTSIEAMRHLDDFLSRLTEAGAEYRQDFPLECTPMIEGRVVGAFEHLMPGAA